MAIRKTLPAAQAIDRRFSRQAAAFRRLGIVVLIKHAPPPAIGRHYEAELPNYALAPA
ncbi:MAG: hypothetical protein HC828_01780 [Blastochloris sp.]|nr:hypothetical protein [Blastochloris sp.]